MAVFQTAPGVSITDLSAIKEEYQIHDGLIRGNISFEKLGPLVTEFYHMLEEPLFLALHVPLTAAGENEAKLESGEETLHEGVYYLDGCTIPRMEQIFSRYGTLFLEDGISQFAVASHSTQDELFIQKYKIFDLLGENRLSYVPLLQKYGLSETSSLKTAWDTFTRETPGTCTCLTINGKRIYDAVEELKDEGLYLAKTVAEN